MNKRERILNISAEARTHSAHDMLARRSGQPLNERLGKVALGKCLAPIYPATLEGYKLLGGGCEQVVYGSKSKVKKIVASSLSTSSSEVKRDITLRQRIHQTFNEHLGRHLLETSYELMRIRGGVYATIAVQPRLNDFESLANPEKNNWHSGIEIDELKALYDSVRSLFSRTEYYPDILGEGNVAIVGAELKIIDTIPVSPSKQKIYLHGRQQTVGQLIGDRLAAWGRHIDNQSADVRPG